MLKHTQELTKYNGNPITTFFVSYIFMYINMLKKLHFSQIPR